jgi:hypothetical protein
MWLIAGPQVGHSQVSDFRARFRRASDGYSKDPIAPGLSVVMNETRATKAVRMDQLGRQVSGWYEEIERHILVPVSKRPLGWNGKCTFKKYVF